MDKNNKEQTNQIEIQYDEILNQMKECSGGKGELLKTKNLFLSIIGYFFRQKNLLKDGIPDKEQIKKNIMNKVKFIVENDLEDIDQIKEFVSKYKDKGDQKLLLHWAEDFMRELDKAISGIVFDNINQQNTVKSFYKALADCYKKWTKPTWINCLLPYWSNFNKFFNDKEKSTTDKLKEVIKAVTAGEFQEAKKIITNKSN